MVDKNALDNMTGREIKELVNIGKIKLDSLDTTALTKLLDYETDMLCLGCGDVNAANACAELLETQSAAPDAEQTEAIIDRVADTHVDAEKSGKKKVIKKKRISIRSIIAAALAVATMLVSATASSDEEEFDMAPYIREAMANPGKFVHISAYESGTYSMDIVITYISDSYHTIDETVEALDTALLYPDDWGSNLSNGNISVSTLKSKSKPKVTMYSTNFDVRIDVQVNKIKVAGRLLREWSYGIHYVTKSGLEFYIDPDICRAVGAHNDHHYTVSARNLFELCHILNTLKEHKP